jgi:adenosylhomocysteine nucleosidase
LPSVVVARGGEPFVTDLHLREILRAAIAARCPVVGGRLLTSAAPIDAIAAKAHLFLETGAVAVDMESAGVAAVAARHGLPFIAVRVIADAAGDALPQAVVAASREGQVRILPLLLGILKSPRQVAQLLRLARRFFRATRTLVAVAATGGLAPLRLAAASPTRVA